MSDNTAYTALAVAGAVFLVLVSIIARQWVIIHTEREVDGDRVMAGILFCKTQGGKPMVAANLFERDGYPVIVNCNAE